MHISHICLFGTKIWKPFHPISPLKPFNKVTRKHVTLHATASDLQAANLPRGLWRQRGQARLRRAEISVRVDEAAFASEWSRTSGCAAAITLGRGAAAREVTTPNTRGGKVSARARSSSFPRVKVLRKIATIHQRSCRCVFLHRKAPEMF